MNPESINSVIDHLADKLAIPTGQLMAMLPRLGYKEMITVIVSGIVLLMGAVLFITPIIMKLGKGYGVNDLTFIEGSIAIGGEIMFLLAGMVFTGSFSNAIFWLHDPQAWALDYVLKMLR